MINVLKKQLKNALRMRVALAFLYLLTIFSVPLNHTCQSAVHKDVHNHHSECTGHRLLSDEHAKVRSVVAFSQHDVTETDKSHTDYCLACLYSLTSRAFKFHPNTPLYLTQTVVGTQLLPQLSFTKQIEWFCSVPPRAPPSITSYQIVRDRA